MPHLPKHDLRLGDVVIEAPELVPAMVQCDLGKETTTIFEVARTLNKPPFCSGGFVDSVEDKYKRQGQGEESFFSPSTSVDLTGFHDYGS